LAVKAKTKASVPLRPIKRLLIANRGEIALRIARTCRAMGIYSIGVYAQGDLSPRLVRELDTTLLIGPAPARDSYLNIERILAAARESRADAIHPGYGFLSENPDFAQACENSGIVFVGPSAAVIRAAGNKISAKKAAQTAGVPTVPGYLGADQSPATLAREAKRMGAPLMLKAAAGGGGKGMRLVNELAAFDDALESAKREAKAAFGDDTVFLEKYIANPRHVEVQVLADAHGHCIHLNERECSIQRRHQKVLEETPSTAVTPGLRARLGEAAIAIAKSVGYTNAGTVEFMLDANGEFYFLEINARLQVEHPITEAVTGVDLVREQINIAAGKPLELQQKDVVSRGHAIEVRVYAEDPSNGFLPSSGRIIFVSEPSGPGVRMDTWIEADSEVSVHYDPLLAKLIVFDQTRDACIGRLRAALADYVIVGVANNISFLRWLVATPAFAQGATTTRFLEEHFRPELLYDDESFARAMLAGAGALMFTRRTGTTEPWQSLGPWRHAFEDRLVRFERPRAGTVALNYDRAAAAWRSKAGDREALVRNRAPHLFSLTLDGSESSFAAAPTDNGIFVSDVYCGELALAPPPDVMHAETHGSVSRSGTGAVAPMTGTIVKVNVKPGDRVKAHQVLVVMEAMKMEHAVAAPYDGIVASVNVKSGDRVDAGTTLAEVTPA
jgi:3-methylcrotonyl-CoA carboxylase alpha subunit